MVSISTRRSAWVFEEVFGGGGGGGGWGAEGEGETKVGLESQLDQTFIASSLLEFRYGCSVLCLHQRAVIKVTRNLVSR